MELTRTEEKVMQILWRLQKAFVKDIVEALDDDPKPAYTTISTIIRILEQKGFVDYIAYGKTHQYFPVISKNEYRQKSFKDLLNNYFEGKPSQVLSYIVQDKSLTSKELEALKALIKQHKK